jgi:hypothetical protein
VVSDEKVPIDALLARPEMLCADSVAAAFTSNAQAEHA